MTYEYLVSALLVPNIEITSYYYSGWNGQWQPTVRQFKISANKVTIVNDSGSDGVVRVFMCLPRVYSNITYMDCLPHYQECNLL